MPEIRTVLQGFSTSTTEGNLSYCGVTLLRGERVTLVDVGFQGRQALLIERLHAMGLEPTDIDRVVLTHAHWDHALNLLRFPNAEVVIHQDEYEYVQHPHADDWATPAYTQDILRRASRVTTVADGEELESGVRVMAVPGHSPGSMAVLVETPEGVVGVVGDALPMRAAAMAPVPSARLIFFDEEAGERSARRILDSCKFVYPGHDRPFAIDAGQFRYIEPVSMTVVNPPRDEDGTVRAAISEAEVPFETTVQPIARRRT
ncbi:MAG: MBL fold metallo-hydrolase [Chloroflexi bacterium]|nr:MBL fold metallo-hydrolase [Chloroflexota bacterium]MDA1002364.1 MBL fold metallo-hydrolase [Chloroflexota bacterium]